MSTRKNTLYNVGYRVFSVLLPLVTAPYLSRTVGQEGVGLYAYAWNINYIFWLIGLLGLENYGTRAIAQARDDREKLNRVFSEIWVMQLMVAGLTLLLYFGYVAFVAGEERDIALSLTLIVVSCLVNPDWVLMGLGQFKPIALRNTAVKLLAAACVFLFVRRKEDLWIYGLSWAAATLLGCLSCAFSLRKQIRFVRVSPRAALAHLKPCSVLALSVIAVSVYRIMDRVMVGAIAGMAQNGLYENAEKIVYCLSGFISAVGTVMLPKVTSLYQRGLKAEALEHMEKSMELVMCMVCAMAFGVTAVAWRLCPLFYGEDFLLSAPLLIPLSFTLIMIGFANVVRTQYILPREKDRIVVRSVLTGAAVNVLVNALLIPRMQAMGAVAGTLCAELAVPLVQYLHLRRELSYRPFLRSLLRYSLLGALMLGAVALLDRLLPGITWMRLGLQVFAGAAVYGLGCLALWHFTGSKWVFSLIRRNTPRR
ncbi:MAG: flippase [Clostridia bacterium]|nr:flippase [Clostridia bacterium]